MTHLFTYGSLMFEDVWSKLVRGTYRSQKATLPHYVRRCVSGEDYPVIFEGKESVCGVVYQDVSDDDMRLLDAFEGEFYERVCVNVFHEKEVIAAQAYVLKSAYFNIIDPKPWSEEAFAKEGIKRFLANYKGFLS